jgi:hypothetical protein
MANFQALLITTRLPLDGAAGRLRLNLISSNDERGRFFDFSATECQLVPHLDGFKKARKLHSPLHLRVVFPPPRGRGSTILVMPGQMKGFSSVEEGADACGDGGP